MAPAAGSRMTTPMVNRRRLVFGGAIVAAALLVLAVLVLLPVILRGVLETRLGER